MRHFRRDERDDERAEIRRKLAHGDVAGRRMAATPARMREQLSARLSDWTGILRRHPAQARQILKKLLVGPLRFTPKGDHYEFEGELSFARMMGDMGFPISVASPPAPNLGKGVRPGAPDPRSRSVGKVLGRVGRRAA